ncbi:hypothetical protein LCGC14_1181340 [marine sediment metagenome]|uniref:Uncharacterized protein n=1 Tax=marine sediment metagenome TaxID=412755 RepID=A0A0F9LM42_9ZZZZ
MTTFVSRVLAGLDDAWGVSIGCNSISDLNLGRHPTLGSYSNGCRYDNVSIPAGATIDSAVVTFTSRQGQVFGQVVEVDIFLEQVDNPGDWAVPCLLFARSLASIVAGATLTTWVLDVNDWCNLCAVPTPDFKAGVQQKVNDAGWASGQAMMLFFHDNGNSVDTLFAVSFERDPNASPLLTITYRETVPSSPRISGTAFAEGDVTLPKGASRGDASPVPGQAGVLGIPGGEADLVGVPPRGAGVAIAVPPPGGGTVD